MTESYQVEKAEKKKGHHNVWAWIAIVGTLLVIVVMSLIVYLKVGIEDPDAMDIGNNSSEYKKLDHASNVQFQGSLVVPLHPALPKKITCKPNTCGENAKCMESTGRGRPKCACPPKHTGDPSTECVKLGCIINDECQISQACINEECVNPCEKNPCAANATCTVFNHLVICSCPAGLTGNPVLEGCKKKANPENMSETDVSEDNDTTELSDKSGRPSDQPVIFPTPQGAANLCDTCSFEIQAPGLPAYTCDPSPCGPNSTCQLFQGEVLCSYPKESEGPGLDNECGSDDDCYHKQACRDLECVDPCSDCGNNTLCKVTEHVAVCRCPKGYSGDPSIRCDPECELDYECPSEKPVCKDHACVDPCIDTCGINARCRFQESLKATTCVCPRRWSGDPLEFCRDPDFDGDNLCDPNPCGMNATCALNTDSEGDEYPICSCPSGYVGNPRISCEISDCDKDSDCTDDLACVDWQCVDPCEDDDGYYAVCGEGARCQSKKHLALCTCPAGTYGDPFVECRRYGGGFGGHDGLIAALLG